MLKQPCINAINVYISCISDGILLCSKKKIFLDILTLKNKNEGRDITTKQETENSLKNFIFIKGMLLVRKSAPVSYPTKMNPFSL